MAIDKSVLSAVCRVHGHNLASLQSEVVRDPRSGDLIPQFKIICVKCGADLDEIAQDVRARRSGGKRKEREAGPALSSPPPPITESPNAAVDEL
jgi:hypothetical protein